MFPDKACLYLCGIEDRQYKEEKIYCKPIPLFCELILLFKVLLRICDICLWDSHKRKFGIIIIYSGYPLHRSVFQWGPAKIMYNAVTILYDAIQYDAIWYDTIRYDTIRYDTIRYDTIRYDTIRYDTIRYDTIRYDTIRYDTIRYDTIRYD